LPQDGSSPLQLNVMKASVLNEMQRSNIIVKKRQRDRDKLLIQNNNFQPQIKRETRPDQLSTTLPNTNSFNPSSTPLLDSKKITKASSHKPHFIFIAITVSHETKFLLIIFPVSVLFLLLLGFFFFYITDFTLLLIVSVAILFLLLIVSVAILFLLRFRVLFFILLTAESAADSSSCSESCEFLFSSSKSVAIESMN
ncbi:hypothetical protein Drorol1_Dr00012241, partial [Drosera rotundifolia]